MTANPLRSAEYPPLPGPFAQPASSSDGIHVSPAVSQLVSTQVEALLASSPAFYQLEEERRDTMRRDLEKIAAYTAALIQADWAASRELGQTPVLRTQTVIGPLPQAAEATSQAAPVEQLAKKIPNAPPPPAFDEFTPRAANEAARITRDTLNAIAFPTFVADLIKGSFNAIVDASIQQMEAYGNLLANVAKTVDQFMADNITDNQARDYLVASYPDKFKLDVSNDGAKVAVREAADEGTKPDFKSQFGLSEDVDLSDEAAEEKLVPAARRHLARSRHQLLSTMVLMGINRIVVTSGRIAAKMGFRIDARDRGTAQSASQFDFKNENLTAYTAGFGFGGVAGYNRNSVAYVSSTKKDSSDEIDVHADLTGEIELKFKSDYFPMERFARPEMLAMIQGNTPNPTANTPITGSGQQKQVAAAAG
jgi:hypothetical protein